MITISLGAIEKLARAIDFYLPPGWRDELGQKVVEAAAVRVGNVEQLRDRFAMAALAGLVARRPGESSSNASLAYEMADAMLLARAKPIDSQFAEVES